MTKRHMKYNPSFLTEEELIDSFVVRHTDLDLIISTIAENNTDSNQHILLIGPRGSGKTTMVHRVAAEIAHTEELNARWYTLIFSEESYEVVSAGEFWLEALFHLAEQSGEEKWQRTFQELKNESDDQRLGERALAQLLDFSDSIGKRILVMVENLNMLLGDMCSEDEAWKIRHTLINEPRLMLLATATCRFEHIENASKAMFEMFKMQDLKPLDDEDCNLVWEHITGQKLLGERITPIRILTGGNPRLLTIIAKFSAHRSFHKLLEDLVNLIDDHTEYFKSHLDSLPPIERKVYLALCGLWDASTAREIAQEARIDINKTSSLLSRLVNRGAVSIEPHGKKTKWYVVSERMYNIYYLMRRRGKPSDRVKATVKFLTSMYDHESAARLITEEACTFPPEFRNNHCLAYEAAIAEISDRELVSRIIAATPKEFLDSPYLSAAVRNHGPICNNLSTGEKTQTATKGESEEAYQLIVRAKKLFEAGEYEQAIPLFDSVITKFANAKDVEIMAIISKAMIGKGYQLGQLSRHEEAIAIYDAMIDRFADAQENELRELVAMALLAKGITLGQLNRQEEAIAVYDAIIGRFADAQENELRELVAMALLVKGVALGQLNRHEEAIAVFDAMIDRFADAQEGVLRELVAEALLVKGVTLGQLNRQEEAIAVYDAMIDRFADAQESELREQVAKALLAKGVTLGQLNRREEEIAVYDAMIDRFADAQESKLREQVAMALVNKGVTLGQLNRLEEAITVNDAIIDRFADAQKSKLREQVAMALVNKGVTLGQLNRQEEAIAVYDAMIDRFTDAQESKLREQVAKALVNKGVALGQLNRLKEAIAVYDAVIDRFADADKTVFQDIVLRAFANKSSVHEELGEYENAETTLRTAISYAPDSTSTTTQLANLYLKMPDRLDEALKIVDVTISNHPADARLLNEIAWNIYSCKHVSLLAKAEQLANKAIALDPDDSHCIHTLACILSALGRGHEALAYSKRFIQDTATVENNIEAAIELFVELAATGQGKEAAVMLKNSEAARHLEPLVVGLKMYIGEEVKTAPEIKEVAKDLTRKIEERKRLRESAR